MPSSYRSPPPSYTSNDINPPHSYSSRAQRSSRHSSSNLSSTVSSTSDCSYPSSDNESSSSSSSKSHLHHHSHFHNHNHSHYNTSDGCSRPANSSNNAGTSEATPLLKSTTSHSSTSREKNDLRYLGIAIVTFIFVAFTCLYWSGLFSKKSELTSFWADIIPAPTCHAAGVREYTATLAGKPEDWGHIQACQKTPFVVHGKPVNARPSCSLFHVPSNDTTSGVITVVQGRWLVDVDENDCQPVWVDITPAPTCHDVGVREYTATLAGYWDDVEVCQKAPLVVHGKPVSATPSCSLFHVPSNDTISGVITIIQGRWLVDFDENDCQPVWVDITPAPTCHDVGVREYTATLAGYWDHVEICQKAPFVVHDKSVSATPSCSLIHVPSNDTTTGSQDITTVQGRWLVDVDETDCQPFWVDIIAAPICHDIGVREYTATLAGDWDKIEVCQKTPFVIHGKPVSATPSCSLVHVPSNDTTTGSRDITVVQGRWWVDFDESDCVPVWSPIESDVCVALGRRSYHAELDYVPPGLDQLTSCRDVPAVIHGREVFSDRCNMVVKHGEGTQDDTLVVRGYWEIDFSEPSCEPLWTSVTDLHCQAYDRRRYTAILEEIPAELDPLGTCYEFPLWLSGSYRTPETCEQQVDLGRVVGSWFVRSPECRPVLKNIQDYGCMESGFKRVEGEPVDFGPHEDWYPICTTMPLRWLGRTYLPEQCETRTSWGHTRRYAMYKIPAPDCP